ncbi:TPA: IgG-binding virulence factor TspB family protein [Neisseria subflava]
MTKNSLSSKSVIAIVSIILVLYFPIESFAARKVSKIPGTDSVNLVWDSDKDLVKNFRREGNNYAFKSNIRTILEHSPTGATRAGVPTIFEAQVSRKAVLSGAFGLVKRGAALGTRLSGWGTAAYFAYEAYQAVNPTLESAGYHYSENADAYLKVYDNALCLGKFMGQPGYYSCIGVDSSVMLALVKGGKSKKDAINLLTMQVQSDYEKIHKDLMDAYFKSDNYSSVLPKCVWNGWGVSCHIKTLSIVYGFIKNYSEELTPDKFLEIATNTIDSNPTPFVEGTGKPEYKENIKVPAGTVVTIGPVTPENGKPVQITITFGQDSNGNTTANVSTTQRPDLDPGSPEAPKSKPDGNPDSNPDGKPDKKPDGNPDDKPDKRPDDKPDPDDEPSDKDKRKEDKKDDKKEESKGLLCNIFPDILACSEKGDVEEQEEPFKIPHINNETTFSPDFFLPDNGVCPAPRTATYLGITMEFKYDMICNFAEMIRFLVIGIAAVAAAFIMFSSRKD